MARFIEFNLKNAVIPLIVVNVIVFILQNIIPKFTESFVLVSADIFTRPWIILTSMFMHANLTHLLFNMYVLFMTLHGSI